MPVWKPKPIEMEPHVDLYRWRIVRVAGSIENEGYRITHHLVGARRDHTVRISSPILAREGDTFTTRSGRTYQTHGEPGLDHEGRWLLGQYRHQLDAACDDGEIDFESDDWMPE